MGGDRLVGALCGEEVEEEEGDDIRATEKALYKALIEEVEPLHGARELIVDLKQSGHAVVLASSAKQDEIDHYLDLLDARGWSTAGRAPLTWRPRSPSPISSSRRSRRLAPTMA